MLRRTAVRLRHGDEVLQGGRANVSRVGISHVAGRAGHDAVLVGLVHVVVGGGIWVRHVVGLVHWLADVLLVMDMLGVLGVLGMLGMLGVLRVLGVLGMMVVVAVMTVVAMGRRIVLGPASTTRGRTAGGRRTHLGTVLPLLPSRQMPPVVHHAGVGYVVVWWCGCCGSCSPDVRATAAKGREARAQ